MIFIDGKRLRETTPHELTEIKMELQAENPEHWDLIVQLSRSYSAERAQREN